MEEIEFKVWCKDNNEWEKDEVFISNRGWQYHTRRLVPVIPKNHIIVLYTGRKDRKGKKIYQGSIVKDSDGQIYTIEWCQQEVGWRMYKGCVYSIPNQDQEKNGWFQLMLWDDLEVIGNIYENPELIENQ